MTYSPMNWRKLIKIRCWTPLDLIGFDAAQVRDTLYRLEPRAFLIAVPHNKSLEAVGNTKFVTSAMWAESEGAALRAALMDIRSDEIVGGLNIPPEMLLPGSPKTYGDIIDVLKFNSPGSYMEYANYSIAQGRAFTHRVIDAKNLKFFFRGRANDVDEAPYAVLRRLPDSA